MRKEGFIAFVKLLLVVLLLLGPIVVTRKIAAQKKNGTTLRSHRPGIMKKGQFYFIGSSRTRSGINDSMLNSRFNTTGFVNIGIDNGTFLFNKIVADKLMQDGGPKTLFIEVSVINARLPAGYRLLVGSKDIIDAVTPLMNNAAIHDIRKIFWPILERTSLSRIRLGPEIKTLLKEPAINGQLGFLRSMNVASAFSPWFLSEKDMATMDERSAHLLYGQLINELLLKAKRSGSRLIFFVPPALKTEAEKAVLTAVFNAIPVENRLLYDQNFLNRLNNNTLFRDETHLNTAGSGVFTDYLAEQVARHNWIQ